MTTRICAAAALLGALSACKDYPEPDAQGPGQVYLVVRRSLVEDYAGQSLVGDLYIARFTTEHDTVEPDFDATPDGLVLDAQPVDLTDGALHDFVLTDEADGEKHWIRAFLDTDEDGVFPEPGEPFSKPQNYGTEPDYTHCYSLLLDQVEEA